MPTYPLKPLLAILSRSLLPVALGACGTTEPICDICTTSAVVYGRVTTASGVPVVGASINVQAYYADTSRISGNFVVGQTNIVQRTDAAGQYRDQPIALASPFRARLVVSVTPPGNAGGPKVVVLGTEVQFREDYRNRGRDSVRVDVIVPDAAK